MDSRDVLVALISGTCDYVPLHGKRDFADVIKGLEVGRLFWNVQWAQCKALGVPRITGVLIRDKGRQKGQLQREGPEGANTAGFEDGGGGQDPRKVGGPERLGKVRIQ